MFKRWRAARKLAKYRSTNPRQNVDEFGEIIIDECHMVCFVNDDYPEEHKMLAMTDVTSQWMFTFGSMDKAIRWADRRANPVVYKICSSFELERILKSGYLPPQVTTSYFAGELIAFCLGPVWASRLEEFNLYEKVTYE